MLKMIARRVAMALATILAVVVLAGLLVHLVPGDPVTAITAYSSASPEAMAEMRASLGLDRPAFAQVAFYILDVLSGDFGTSVRGNEPVAKLFLDRLPNTLILAAAALTIAMLIGLPLGVIAAIRRGSAADTGITAVTLLGASMPAFWLGLVLIQVFAVELRWLPVAGTDFRSLALPAVTLGIAYGALIARMTRSVLIDILAEDYIRTARARGLREHQVLLGHALRPALIGIITVIGIALTNLLGGQVVIENIFSWNGIGRLGVQSMLQRDYPMIQGFVIIFAASVVIISMTLDILYMLADPRLRRQ